MPRVTATKASPQKTGIDWSQEIIYFLLIDRFFDGDPSNNHGRVPQSHSKYDGDLEHFERLKTYQGGDLQGVLDKLDYIQKLGATTIWLSPIFDNSDSAFVGWWPYHGYHPEKFFIVDEHFGTIELLRELVDAAHTRGMKVLLDMVYNQVSSQHPWVRDPENWESKGYKFWFHPHSGVDGSTSIQNWQDQHQLETRELHGMPDFCQENPHVYEFLLDVSKFLIEETHCDGFRLDAVKHIPKSFWKKFCRDIHRFAGEGFLLLGEIFDGSVDYVAGYADLGFNALFDIPMYFTIKRVFAQGGSVKLLSEHLAENQKFGSEILLSTLIDNHDVARFSFWANDNVKRKLMLAMTFAFTQSGTPMIYYGTEVAVEGAAPVNPQTGQSQDYLNRLMMPWERVNGNDADLVEYCRKIFHLRQKSAALQHGKTIELYKDHGVYAYLRSLADEDVLVLINTSSFEESRTIPLRGSLFADKNRITDELAKTQFNVSRDSLFADMAPRSSYIFRLYQSGAQRNLNTTRWDCSFTNRLTKDFCRIRFILKAARGVRSMSVAGDFNGWDSQANQMSGPNSEGEWSTEIPLRSGRYRYKFVLNGKDWVHDPKAAEFEKDPYGALNSVIVVK